jgi:hypothetical protein
VIIVTAVVGEYAGNWGNEAAVGNGCGNGVWNVAVALAVPIFSLPTENGGAKAVREKACPVGREK